MLKKYIVRWNDQERVERLLETSAAVELLPELTIQPPSEASPIRVAPTVAPTVAPHTVQTSQYRPSESPSGQPVSTASNNEKTPENIWFPGVSNDGRYRTRICDLCRVKAAATNRKRREMPKQTTPQRE